MRLLLVAALLFGFLAVGVVPARAVSTAILDFVGGDTLTYTLVPLANSQWVDAGSLRSSTTTDPNGCGTAAQDANVHFDIDVNPLWHITAVRVRSLMTWSNGHSGGNGSVKAFSDQWYHQFDFFSPAHSWTVSGGSVSINGASVIRVFFGACWGPSITSYIDYVEIDWEWGPTPTPTATGTPLPTATPLLVWLPTTDYRPICTVVSDLNLTETAVAPSPFPSLVVPTMATYVLQVPTLHVPTMVLPGAPTLTPSLSPTASETPWPTLNLPTVTPTNTRTPTPTLTCRLPDDVYPIIDVGGLVPEREPQCFRMIPLIDWDIPPINLVLFTTPEVNVHIPAVDFCVTWLPLRLSILGMDFTALLAVGLALLGARFIMGFRKEL